MISSYSTGTLRRPALHPGREALMKLGARLLQHLLVDGVPDQDVREPERALAGEARRRPAGSSPCPQRLEVRVEVAPRSPPAAAPRRHPPELLARRSRPAPAPSAARRLSRPSRAASSARIVGGIATADSSSTARHRRPLCWRTPSSTSMRRISSRNSGFPSPAEAIRWTSSPISVDAEQVADQPVAVGVAEGLQHQRARAARPLRPSPAAARAAPGAPCRSPASGRRRP